jgi:hypothetical protein
MTEGMTGWLTGTALPNSLGESPPDPVNSGRPERDRVPSQAWD